MSDFGYLDKRLNELHAIALDELLNGNHGGFLTHFLEAFIRADPFNKRILADDMEFFIKKYGLGRKKHDRDKP